MSCWKEIILSKELVELFKTKGKIDLSQIQEEFYPNQGIIINNSIIAVQDPKKQVIRKLVTNKASDMMPGTVKDLQLLYDYFWNDNIKVIVIDGVAGSGKTSTTMAFANEFALKQGKKKFESGLIISRPNFEVGEGYGFLPGDINEKLDPHMAAFYQWIHRFNQHSIEELRQIYEQQRRGGLLVQPVSYIRGLDISDSMFVFDEAQNATPEQIKTIITRLTDNVKAIFLGDSSPNQIDVKGLSENYNGLKHLKDGFKGKYDWFAYVDLKQCLRGEICKAAVKDL